MFGRSLLVSLTDAVLTGFCVARVSGARFLLARFEGASTGSLLVRRAGRLLYGHGKPSQFFNHAKEPPLVAVAKRNRLSRVSGTGRSTNTVNVSLWDVG
jgi:hypothetical protein